MAYGSPSGKSPVSMEDTRSRDRYPGCIADMRSDKGGRGSKFNFPKEDHIAPVRIIVRKSLSSGLEEKDLDLWPSTRGGDDDPGFRLKVPFSRSSFVG